MNEADIALAQRVGFDSMIPERWKVFQAIIAGKAITDSSLPASTASYRAGDLEAVGLLSKHALANRYSLTDLARELLDKINPAPVIVEEAA